MSNDFNIVRWYNDTKYTFVKNEIVERSTYTPSNNYDGDDSAVIHFLFVGREFAGEPNARANAELHADKIRKSEPKAKVDIVVVAVSQRWEPEYDLLPPPDQYRAYLHVYLPVGTRSYPNKVCQDWRFENARAQIFR